MNPTSTRSEFTETGLHYHQVYAYDGLHRLQNVEGGTLSSGSITSRQLEQDWTLDQLGNWSTFKQRDTDTGSTWDLDQDRAHNDVNEIDDGSENGITTIAYQQQANIISTFQAHRKEQ